MYCIAVFRSQTQTYSFCNLLMSYGINSSVVPTPRQAEVSCGLSVKFSPMAIEMAKSLLCRREWNSYVGLFTVQDLGNGVCKVKRVI